MADKHLYDPSGNYKGRISDEGPSSTGSGDEGSKVGCVVSGFFTLMILYIAWVIVSGIFADAFGGSKAKSGSPEPAPAAAPTNAAPNSTNSNGSGLTLAGRPKVIKRFEFVAHKDGWSERYSTNGGPT